MDLFEVLLDTKTDELVKQHTLDELYKLVHPDWSNKQLFLLYLSSEKCLLRWVFTVDRYEITEKKRDLSVLKLLLTKNVQQSFNQRKEYTCIIVEVVDN